LIAGVGLELDVQSLFYQWIIWGVRLWNLVGRTTAVGRRGITDMYT